MASSERALCWSCPDTPAHHQHRPCCCGWRWMWRTEWPTSTHWCGGQGSAAVNVTPKGAGASGRGLRPRKRVHIWAGGGRVMGAWASGLRLLEYAVLLSGAEWAARLTRIGGPAPSCVPRGHLTGRVSRRPQAVQCAAGEAAAPAAPLDIRERLGEWYGQQRQQRRGRQQGRADGSQGQRQQRGECGGGGCGAGGGAERPTGGLDCQGGREVVVAARDRVW